MYTSIGIVILALLLLLLLGICFKRRAIKQVCSMSDAEKSEQLSLLLEPFGYCYLSGQDIISSRNDAWQRTFGYSAFFDRAAPHLNMVFDCLPVYFDYRGKTWLMEFWKGQYGINTGAEIGLYYADEIIPKEKRSAELFKAVDDAHMMPMCFELIKDNFTLSSVSKTTWWLTAFCMGQFSKPNALSLSISLHFPCCEMMHSFVTALLETGFCEDCIRISGLRVMLLFHLVPGQSFSCWQKFVRSFAQFFNRILCRLFLILTKPFHLTVDRLLYLYYLLPFTRRSLLSPRKCKKSRHH